MSSIDVQKIEQEAYEYASFLYTLYVEELDSDIIEDGQMQHKTLPTSLLMVVGAFLGYALTLSKKLPLPSVKESCYEANKSSCVLSCVNG